MPMATPCKNLKQFAKKQEAKKKQKIEKTHSWTYPLKNTSSRRLDFALFSPRRGHAEGAKKIVARRRRRFFLNAIPHCEMQIQKAFHQYENRQLNQKPTTFSAGPKCKLQSARAAAEPCGWVRLRSYFVAACSSGCARVKLRMVFCIDQWKVSFPGKLHGFFGFHVCVFPTCRFTYHCAQFSIYRKKIQFGDHFFYKSAQKNHFPTNFLKM